MFQSLIYDCRISRTINKLFPPSITINRLFLPSIVSERAPDIPECPPHVSNQKTAPTHVLDMPLNRPLRALLQQIREERERQSERMASPKTRMMLAVNQSSIHGYPHPSISSRRAFQWTLEKIVRTNPTGFHFLFLHVQIPDEDGFDDMDSIYASPEDFQRMKQRDRTRGLHLLEYFVGLCHQNGISCEAWIKKGKPEEEICREVRRVQPDVLVIGNRGLGPFQRIFVGTVSEFCVKHAECPVICIKRSEDEAPQDPVDD